MENQPPTLPPGMRAYHEAGHAVAAHVLGLRILSIDIHLDGRYGGTALFDEPEGSDDPNIWRYHALRKFKEDFHVMLMAGCPASLQAPDVNPALAPATQMSDINLLIADMEAAFIGPYDDACVRAMRDGYAGEMPDTEKMKDTRHRLIQIYSIWIESRAEALIAYPPNRYAIQSLANVLMEQGALSGNQVHEVIATALAEYSTTREQS